MKELVTLRRRALPRDILEGDYNTAMHKRSSILGRHHLCLG